MAASRLAATIVVPQLRWTASFFSPALKRLKASRAALSTSSVERTPCTKKPSSVEKPLNLRRDSLSIITTIVACSKAWFRLRILFPNMFLSCRGYTNKLPTACNEYTIGSRNRNKTKINVTNKISKNATPHHPHYGELYVLVIIQARPAPKANALTAASETATQPRRARVAYKVVRARRAQLPGAALSSQVHPSGSYTGRARKRPAAPRHLSPSQALP